MKFLYLIFFLSFIPYTWAQEEDKHPLLADEFYGEIGVFIPQKDIKFGASGESEDSDVDFSETFDLNDNQATPFLNLEWRWNKKWRLTAEGFSVNNAAKATLPSDITWDGVTFEKGPAGYSCAPVQYAVAVWPNHSFPPLFAGCP